MTPEILCFFGSLGIVRVLRKAVELVLRKKKNHFSVREDRFGQSQSSHDEGGSIHRGSNTLPLREEDTCVF